MMFNLLQVATAGGVATPVVTRKSCAHRHCQFAGTKKPCCACSDKRSATARAARDAYRSYCPACFSHLGVSLSTSTMSAPAGEKKRSKCLSLMADGDLVPTALAAEYVAATSTDVAVATASTDVAFLQPACLNDAEKMNRALGRFRQREVRPLSRLARGVLHINYLLRQIFPFDVTHIILCATTGNAPMIIYRYIHTDNHDGKCPHRFCQLRNVDCCACLDKRADKTLHREYVDGVGKVMMLRPFYQHYCHGCRNHYAELDTAPTPSRLAKVIAR